MSNSIYNFTIAALVLTIICGFFTVNNKYKQGLAEGHSKAEAAVMEVYYEKCGVNRTVENTIRNEEYCNGVRDTGLNVINSEWSIK